MSKFELGGEIPHKEYHEGGYYVGGLAKKRLHVNTAFRLTCESWAILVCPCACEPGLMWFSRVWVSDWVSQGTCPDLAIPPGYKGSLGSFRVKEQQDSAAGREAVVKELEEQLDGTGVLGQSSGTEQGWVSEHEVNPSTVVQVSLVPGHRAVGGP